MIAGAINDDRAHRAEKLHPHTNWINALMLFGWELQHCPHGDTGRPGGLFLRYGLSTTDDLRFNHRYSIRWRCLV